MRDQTSDAHWTGTPGMAAARDAPEAAIRAALLEAASQPYRSVSRFAYHFARGKLRSDPVYTAILAMGLLHGRSRVLDLGCGQGLLTAWLRAAERCYQQGTWPPGWAPAPRSVSTLGIELMHQDVERARRALGPDTQVLQGDIRTVAYGEHDAVVILDVLHYLDDDWQHDILRRVRDALPCGGLLLLRVGDADGGLRFRYGLWVDQIIMRCRGHGGVRMHCRSTAQWSALLQACGFECEPLPMSQGTLFANVLLVARAR